MTVDRGVTKVSIEVIQLTEVRLVVDVMNDYLDSLPVLDRGLPAHLWGVLVGTRG